jgi:putative transcriptional regulator
MPDVAVFAFRAPAPQRDASHVVRDVHISSSPEVLHRLLGRERPTEGLRVFAGLAGWAPGQLDAEIERGDWRRLPADAESIFDAKPESLWARLYRRAFAVQVRGRAGNPPPARPVDSQARLLRTSCRTLPAAPCASTSPPG